jgi:hypothetical protein
LSPTLWLSSDPRRGALCHLPAANSRTKGVSWSIASIRSIIMVDMDKMALSAVLELVSVLKKDYPSTMQDILIDMDLSDEAFDHFENRLKIKLD